MPDRLYLDWNATTPAHPDVIAAMERARERAWANPSSVHAAGRAALGYLEAARETVASVLRCHPRDVVFTASGTEANNLALRGASALITSRIEHPSVVRVAEALEHAGRPVAWLPVGESGRVEPDAVRGALDALGESARAATVAVMAVNHETGVRQPVAELLELTRSAGARLHSDAVQALGKVELGDWVLADSLTVAAHKIRGPKGIAALVWRGAPPEPVLLGGAQERGIRPGTQDAVAAEGFRVAVERARSTPAELARLAGWRADWEASLAGRAVVNGTAERAPHVSNVSVDGWAGDELVAALDLEGICISSGSACSAGSSEPSLAISEMVGSERARRAIRVSFGEGTERSAVDRLIATCSQLVSSQVAES